MQVAWQGLMQGQRAGDLDAHGNRQDSYLVA